jgi:hypothetical protein
MESELNWRPLVPLQSGLEQTVEWYGENAGWVEAIRRGEYLTYYRKYYENRNASLEAIMSAGSDSGAPAAGEDESLPRKGPNN